MSLLMDALKKAEEEKKRAAKRLEQVESDARSVTGEHEVKSDDQQKNDPPKSPKPFTETVELSLEPIAEKPGNEKIPAPVSGEKENDTVPEEKVPTVDVTESFSEDLTLENTIAEESFEQTQASIDLNDTTIIEGLSTESASAPFDDTFHGVLLEDDAPEVDVYEETLPGVPAETLAQDLGGGDYQPTPVAAQTVFSAGKAGKKSNAFRWGIISILLFIAIGSFIVFYYFSITPVTRQLPSPLVARGVESVPAPVPAITAVAEPDVVTGTIISPEVEQQDAPAEEVASEVDDVQENISENMMDTEVIVDVEDSDAIDAIEPVLDASTTGSAPEEQAQVVEDDGVDNEIVAADYSQAKDISEDILEENIQADLSFINISKSKLPKKQSLANIEAFKAYKAGQLAAAKSLYQGVLKQEPDNRDAHLGLAAIAINENDRTSAYVHYLYLLKVNPNDALALNAVVGLSNSDDPVKDESAIKILLQKEGDVPYLYFSLGNLYAKQQRWSEAQQAFFDAYRLDTSNPDYVLNLAVSLDRLGQYSTALDYYKTAIDLAQETPSRFDFSSVKKRISLLNKFNES